MARPRKRLALEVEQELRRFAQAGFAPAQILAYLRRKYPEQTATLTTRTVQRRVLEYGPPDTSDSWTLANASPQEAAVVLSVIASRLRRAAALARSAGPDDLLVQFLASRSGITTALTKWLVRVAAAAPTLPPELVDVVAQEYRDWELSRPRPGTTAPLDLDAFLALRPWESPRAAADYEELVAMGVIAPLCIAGKPISRWWGDGRQAEEADAEKKENDDGEASRAR